MQLLHDNADVDAMDSISHLLIDCTHVYLVVDIHLTGCRKNRKREIREEVLERSGRHIHMQLAIVSILECIDHNIAISSIACTHLDCYLVAIHFNRKLQNHVSIFQKEVVLNRVGIRELDSVDNRLLELVDDGAIHLGKVEG